MALPFKVAEDYRGMSITFDISEYQFCDVLSYIPVVSTVTTLFHTVMAKSRQSDLFRGRAAASASAQDPTTTYNYYIERFLKIPNSGAHSKCDYNWRTICIEACPFGKLIQLLFSSCFAKKQPKISWSQGRPERDFPERAGSPTALSSGASDVAGYPPHENYGAGTHGGASFHRTVKLKY